MKKTVSLFLALLLVAGCLGICGTATAETEKNEMQFTQETAVKKEKYLKDKAVQAFLSMADKRYLIPGLNQGIIPQGMDYSDETGLLYISGYYKQEGVPSVLVAVNAETGSLDAEYRLLQSDGSAFTSHVGGVAVCGDTLYVSGGSDGRGLYEIAAIALADLPLTGSWDITITEMLKSPVSPSFLNCSAGYLWVGNFYHPSAKYDLCPEMNYTTETGDGAYGCYILGYDVQRDLRTEEGRYPLPDLILAAPDRIQGMVCSSGQDLYLSQSYGRKNDSTIFHYRADLAEPDITLMLGENEIPALILDHMRLHDAVTAMPMTEAMCLGKDGEVLVLFESGAVSYSDGRNRTDHIWQLNMD